MKAGTVQRIIPATDARAIAPPGASTRTNRGPINRKTKTSTTRTRTERALITGNPVPAAHQRRTETNHAARGCPRRWTTAAAWVARCARSDGATLEAMVRRVLRGHRRWRRHRVGDDHA